MFSWKLEWKIFGFKGLHSDTGIRSNQTYSKTPWNREITKDIIFKIKIIKFLYNATLNKKKVNLNLKFITLKIKTSLTVLLCIIINGENQKLIL
jgi:hypothetical protein